MSDRDDPTARALTDLARLNNELVAMQRQLAKNHAALARVSEQKSEILGTVAHDLRSPLTVVTTLSELLLQEGAGPLNPEQREILDVMTRSLVAMSGLVESLLDFSSIEAGVVRLTLEDVPLAQALRDDVRQNLPLLGRRRIRAQLDVDTLEPPLSPELVLVRADRAKLRQVVDNLLGNVAKYAPDGSSVQVRARREDDLVRVEVADEGPGIPEAEQPSLFKPFGRTSVRPRDGQPSTGLGLAIARKILEAQGGSIGLTSRPGSGSTFHFILPVASRVGRADAGAGI
jgi:signal transduction histidine kinase